jgi:cyclopropane fatty-acyl-phospholipid synthase-like methyltransferase
MDRTTELTDYEKQLLDAVLSLEMHPYANPEEAEGNIKAGERMAPNAENLRKRGQLIQVSTFGKNAKLMDWTAAYPRLMDAGFIQFNDGIYQLTATGRIQAKHVRTERIGKRFSDYFIRSAKSKSQAVFCQRVFGKNLCQADMMDMMQLEKLLDVLVLSAENKVLDLGCGIGAIAEYISDTTGARIVGVDIANEAITHAQEHTWQKRDRLDFRYGDMNNLGLQPASFDTIIAIASLHYAEDLDETIRQLIEFLTPDGQMGLFAFQYASEFGPPEILLPENTDLARTLQKHSLDFQTWEFTKQEIEIRRRQLQVARELMEAYRKEGNLDLCEDRIEECEIDLPRLKAGLKRRYLYHIRLG